MIRATRNFSFVQFPQDIRNCTVCHTGTTEAENYKTAPNRDRLRRVPRQ